MVKSNKTSKRIKPSSKDAIDRISNLPEPLISQILSLIPTKNAVATSVLSTRWKFLWTSITSLNFDEKTLSSHQKKRKTEFVVFINWVLFQITPLCIQDFRLHCSHKLFDPLHLKMWITIIAPTIRELDLGLILYPEAVELQMNHFRFNKLVVLKLQGIDFNIPAQASVCFSSLQTLHLSFMKFEIAGNSSVSFPNLTVLHSKCVGYANEESVHKFFSSCPALEDLDIDIDYRTKFPCIIICIPSLTMLKVDSVCRTRTNAWEIQIDKLGKLKCLSISNHALKAIVRAFVNNNLSSDFHDLRRLDLEEDDCSGLSFVMKNLLERMEYLEHLVIRRVVNSCSCSRRPWWTEPMNVPKCLVSQVTTIAFIEKVDYCHDELELVRYFMKNTEVLRVFKLGATYISLERKLQLIKKISLFPKGSEACQVEFT